MLTARDLVLFQVIVRFQSILLTIKKPLMGKGELSTGVSFSHAGDPVYESSRILTG